MMVNKNQPFVDEDSKCTRAVYTLDPKDDKKILVENTGLTGDKPNQKVSGIDGYGYQENGSGNFSLSFNGIPFTEFVYKVIDTDYKEHSIIYGCQNIFGVWQTESVFVLTRKALVIGS